MRKLIRTYFLSSCLLLNACSHIPPAIENAPPRDISYTQAIQYFEKHKNLTVRWGGIVVDLINERYQSFMQVLVYPVDRDGRPDLNQPSVGHFIVKSPKFLDPAVYKLDAEVTVSGILESMVEQQSIDNRVFKVPVVLPGVIYLWSDHKSYNYPYYQATAGGGYGGYYGNYYQPGGHISYPAFPLQNIQRTQNHHRQRQEQEAHRRLREEQETRERQREEPQVHDRLREEQETHKLQPQEPEFHDRLREEQETQDRQREEQAASERQRQEQESQERQREEQAANERQRQEQESQERQREEQAANERQRQEQESQERQREEQAANERQRQEQEAQQHQQAEQATPTPPPPKPNNDRKREE